MVSGIIPGREEDFIDEYVVGIQNPAQLISSLALILRERNYVCLYDTSVLSSPEHHIKRSSVEELNRDFLYKWFLFFTGLVHNLKSFPNLIVIPEVAEEMSNLATATLSSIEKRKNQYKALAPHQKEKFQDVFEQILKNEEILADLNERLIHYREHPAPVVQPIFEYFLELIKLLDVNLDLKKPCSRESNDTDERLASRAFYEIIVNSRNLAIYTRDDDIRKLISATFKFLISREICEDTFPFLKNLSHFNLIVLKYNYEKKVFSRFFESSTLPYIGEFRFPRKLSRGKVNQIISNAKEILHKINEELQKVEEQQVPTTDTEESKKQSQEHCSQAMENIFNLVSEAKVDEENKMCKFQIGILNNLAVLANSFGQNGLQEKITETKRGYQRASLENTILHLKQEQDVLQQQFDKISGQSNHGIEYWQQVQDVAETIRENLLRLHFFENALRANLDRVTQQDYEKYKILLAEFRNQGFHIEDKETPIPKEKIAEITGNSINNTIRVIEKYQLKHQRTHVYLTQEHLLLFMSNRSEDANNYSDVTTDK